MKYDVFVSYSTEDLAIVKKIVVYLESRGIKCFAAYQDIPYLAPRSGDFAAAIFAAMNNSWMILAVCSENFNASEHTSKELHLADALKLPILPVWVGRGKAVFTGAKGYFLTGLNRIEVAARKRNECINDYICNLLKIIKGGCKMSGTNSRHRNNYFSIDNEHEVERLKTQMELLEDFDRDVYDRLLSDQEDVNILDVGTNSGDAIMQRFGCRKNVKTIIGVDINEDAINVANARYGKTKGTFYQLDIESGDFIQELMKIMNERHIDGFDFINISMLLLHLENPAVLIKELQKVLKKDGIMFIRDIDDGFNIAYPDKGGLFKNAIEICGRNDLSGFRYSGREIPKFLWEAGMQEVKMEKLCLDSLGMDDNQKNAFFNTYFSFVYDDAMARYKEDNRRRENKDDASWLFENIDTLRTRFLEPGFFFCLGFVIFTARKKS